MSVAAAKIVRPALKNLNDNRLRKHFLISGVAAVVTGLAYVVFVERRRMIVYQKWIDNFDDKKEYERLKKHHVFRSLNAKGEIQFATWE